LKDLLKEKPHTAELQQRLHLQRFKLEQASFKINERMEQSRKEAKECLERGDEIGFRVASRKYILSKNTASSINDLRGMAMEMIDLVELGGILHDVIGAGGDLAKVQNKLGINSSKLESSLAKIMSSMTHMDHVATALSTTINSALATPTQLTMDQEILRKELLAEMQAEKAGVKLVEKVSTEVKEAQKV
jgi:hypothetical protein